jgi:hypothetical protein
LEVKMKESKGIRNAIGVALMLVIFAAGALAFFGLSATDARAQNNLSITGGEGGSGETAATSSSPGTGIAGVVVATPVGPDLAGAAGGTGAAGNAADTPGENTGSGNPNLPTYGGAGFNTSVQYGSVTLKGGKGGAGGNGVTFSGDHDGGGGGIGGYFGGLTNGSDMTTGLVTGAGQVINFVSLT